MKRHQLGDTLTVYLDAADEDEMRELLDSIRLQIALSWSFKKDYMKIVVKKELLPIALAIDELSIPRAATFVPSMRRDTYTITWKRGLTHQG